MADQTNMPPEQIMSIQYQMEHLGDDRRPVVIGVCWALWSLAVTAVGLRFWAKNIVRSGFKPEDGLILMGLLGATGCVMNTTIGTAFGAGLHIVLASNNDLLVTNKLWFYFQLTYTFTLVLIKLSILAFFYRIFGPNRAFRNAVWCVTTLLSSWFLATSFVTVFQCNPVTYFWNRSQPGRCIDSQSFTTITAIINVIFTFIIVVLPAPIIWKLDIPKRQRFGICGIFFLGGIVLVASIVRLVYLRYPSKYDGTYDTVDTCIWSAVEPNVAVVGACLPMLAPIFRRVKEISTGKNSSGSSERGWNHTRLEESHSEAKQLQWPVPPKGSMGLGHPSYGKTDNVPLTSHSEWADSNLDTDREEPNENTSEIQRHGTPQQTVQDRPIQSCFPSIQELESLPSIQETECAIRMQALSKTYFQS